MGNSFPRKQSAPMNRSVGKSFESTDEPVERISKLGGGKNQLCLHRNDSIRLAPLVIFSLPIFSGSSTSFPSRAKNSKGVP